MIEKPGQFSSRIQSRNWNIVCAQNLRVRVGLDPSVRECQIYDHGICVVWRCVNRIYPAGLIGPKSCGRLPIKLHEIQLVIAGSIELLNYVLKLIRRRVLAFCKLKDGVRLLMLLVGGVTPNLVGADHNRLVCDEVCPLILISPSL